jgi:hypothetical protein
MPTVSYKMLESATNRKFTVRGTGSSRAAAVAEANAKLAMTVGTIDGSSISEELAAGELGTAHGAGTFSDAVLILQNGSGKRVSIKLDNISTAVGTGVAGQLDLADALVTDFATAYRDGDGNGGYAPYDGYFVD